MKVIIVKNLEKKVISTLTLSFIVFFYVSFFVVSLISMCVFFTKFGCNQVFGFLMWLAGFSSTYFLLSDNKYLKILLDWATLPVTKEIRARRSKK